MDVSWSGGSKAKSRIIVRVAEDDDNGVARPLARFESPTEERTADAPSLPGWQHRHRRQRQRRCPSFRRFNDHRAESNIADQFVAHFRHR